MQITPNQDFKHQGQTYAKGQEYEVPNADAEHFELCGWVGDALNAEAVHTLEVQNVQLGHESEVN